MGNIKKPDNNSRRWFFLQFLKGKEKASNAGKVKMLTADGKLVEVDKAVYEQLTQKQKASNKEILSWMNNPSKDENS